MVTKIFIEIDHSEQSKHPRFDAMLDFLGTNSDIDTVIVESSDQPYEDFDNAIELESLCYEIHMLHDGFIVGSKCPFM